MGRTSAARRSKDREKIEKAIIEGVPERTIASRFDISRTAIRYYKKSIAAQIASVMEKRTAKTIDYVQEQEELRQVMLGQLKDAKDQTLPFPLRLSMLNQCITTLSNITDRLVKYTGQSKEPGATVNIQLNVFEQMPVVRATLAMFPEALGAVDRALREKLNGNGRG